MAIKLILENFRSFHGEHEIPMSKLNILTGSNSSGKTAFLAAAATVFSEEFPNPSTLFREPFSYNFIENIASDGMRNSRIGYMVPGGESHEETTHIVDIGVVNRIPAMKKYVAMVNEQFSVTLSRKDSKLHVVRLDYLKDGRAKRSQTLIPSAFFDQENGGNAMTAIDILALRPLEDKEFGDIGPLTRSRPFKRSKVLAPIRSRPQVMHSKHVFNEDPEGGYVVSRIAEEYSSKKLKKIDQIVQFAKDSGIFDGLSRKRVRMQTGENIQLLIDMGNSKRTLVDIGYGISQVLPVLYEIISTEIDQLLLMEQPEVHIHPRVQAELGTLIADRVASGANFVVETHSDYLIDRVRIAVKRGVIKPEDVNILFFEMKDGVTRVTSINLDDRGNMIDMPDEYRKFFLADQMELLGF